MWSSSTCRSHGRGCRSRCTTSPGRSGASSSVPPRTTKPPESVYYERRGRTDGAAPPVLFLHGLGSSAADWAPQLGPFGQRYRLPHALLTRLAPLLLAPPGGGPPRAAPPPPPPPPPSPGPRRPPAIQSPPCGSPWRWRRRCSRCSATPP